MLLILSMFYSIDGFQTIQKWLVSTHIYTFMWSISSNLKKNQRYPYEIQKFEDFSSNGSLQTLRASTPKWCTCELAPKWCILVRVRLWFFFKFMEIRLLKFKKWRFLFTLVRVLPLIFLQIWRNPPSEVQENEDFCSF